jgi:hypothetical protein
MGNIASNTNKTTIPTIIGIADSTHYLVGRVDSGNNFTGLESTQQNEVFSSITEAKNYLRAQNIFCAVLEFQTAYDEMCGSSVPNRCTQMITF